MRSLESNKHEHIKSLPTRHYPTSLTCGLTPSLAHRRPTTLPHPPLNISLLHPPKPVLTRSDATNDPNPPPPPSQPTAISFIKLVWGIQLAYKPFTYVYRTIITQCNQSQSSLLAFSWRAFTIIANRQTYWMQHRQPNIGIRLPSFGFSSVRNVNVCKMYTILSTLQSQLKYNERVVAEW